jgi:WD40 repeat protein
VAFSPDGRLLASGSGDNTIKLWEVASGSEVRTLSGHTRCQFRGVQPRRAAPGLRLHGRHDQAVGGGQWQPRAHPLRPHHWVESVAFSPDGRLLASGSWDNTIKLWDVATGREVRTLTGHTDTVNSVAFSPDGRLLASGSYDNTIKLWDISDLVGR